MSTPTTPAPGRGYRAEGIVQVLILLTIASMAAAASFTHVHNVAAAHAEGGWLAWADAVVLELMSIATGLEIRRRHRGGQPAGFVLGVLVAAVVLSLSAQVVEAERSVVGWLAAALPALGFLALVKIVLSRTPAGPEPTHPGTSLVPGSAPDPTPVRLATDPASVLVDDQDDTDPATDLLDQARLVAADHLTATGRPITRDQLRARLRTSTDTATVLHRQVREDGRPGLVPVPADTFTRVPAVSR
jgi:hypothetical protein